MKEIEITINPDGSAEIDLKGFEGHGCKEITDQLLKGTGATIIKRTQKQEYYKPVVKPKVIQHQGT